MDGYPGTVPPNRSPWNLDAPEAAGGSSASSGKARAKKRKSPEELEVGAAEEKGTCAWYDTQKGFGFIRPSSAAQGDAGKDEEIFVHQSEINVDGFRKLERQQHVVFSRKVGANGKVQAANVRVVEGAGNIDRESEMT